MTYLLESYMVVEFQFKSGCMERFVERLLVLYLVVLLDILVGKLMLF
ncbi:Uncharacterised protein [Mycobacterium tuberculosis]|nr:Uncharacterised protein [Mycobacterium tuberculosis]